MSQTRLDDDELFGEAAEEVRGDVEDHLAAARASLPDPDAIWTVESDNTLGILNGLKGALDVGDAEAHLRDAKKWYTMGERAGAFENGEDIEADIEELDGVITDVVAARGQVAELASTLPEIRTALEAADRDGADGADGTDGADGADGTDGTDGADGADGTDGTDGDVGRKPDAGAEDGAEGEAIEE